MGNLLKVPIDSVIAKELGVIVALVAMAFSVLKILVNVGVNYLFSKLFSLKSISAMKY